MEGYQPFKPGASTYLIPAATPASTPIQIGGRNSGDVTYQFYNASTTTDAFISYATTSATAAANAVVPTAGNPQPVLFVPAGAVLDYTLNGQMWLSGVVSSGSATVFVTPGEGA